MTTLPRPDPTLGVFETLLVVDGEPVELGAHLDRLTASLGTLLGAELPVGLATEVDERARGLRLGRLRLAVVPGPLGPRTTLASEDVDAADLFPDRTRGGELRSCLCAGGLGHHKWADRRPLAEAASTAVPLLFDRDDEVLEAGRANVFAVHRGVVSTPAADGRILPGIARAGAIAGARQAGIEVLERPLRRAELLSADEVFLTGSVRGVEPARSLDGVALPAVTELARRIGAGLRRRWGVELETAVGSGAP